MVHLTLGAHLRYTDLKLETFEVFRLKAWLHFFITD